MSDGGKGLRGHILISHTHWDHIQGVPFFAPLFEPGNEWDIYGPKGLGPSLRETLAGQMQHTYFPVTLDQFGATIRYHDSVEGTFQIDDIKVSTHYLNHPALTLGYRLEADGASLAYSCDHEPHSRALATGQGEFAGQDLAHAKFVEGADLLIHDAQYTAAEYPTKIGWGHSTAEYAVWLSQRAHVKSLALTHHDPLRDDDALDQIVETIRAGIKKDPQKLRVIAAAEGEIIEIEPSHAKASDSPAGEFEAMSPVEPALAERSVLLCIVDPYITKALSESIHAEGIRAHFISDISEAKKIIAEERPYLAIIEHDLPDVDGIAVSREIRQIEGGDAHQLPLVMVAPRDETPADAAAGITDWLIKPFSDSYARTKIRSWVLRTACRWIRAATPNDEAKRITSLRQLGILDTEPEERFDRVTRLAAAVFDVPVVLISLLDKDRNWFKSCFGISLREAPRDSAFCAHVIFSREPVIVEDTFSDDRFADNPLVINEPRVRFYAGYPLILEDGSCIGTLCLFDIRPRSMDENDLERLHDLADIALQEIYRFADVKPPNT